MKNNTVRKMIAITAAMSLMVPGYHVAAEEIVPETQVKEEVSIEENVEPEEEIEEEYIADSEDLYLEMAGEESEEQIIEPEVEESIVEVPVTESVDIEAESETETEPQTEETAEFRFENEEVIIKANIDSEEELPENLKMVVNKVEEDSDTFAMAKAASINSFGTEEEASYSFYEVTFEVDGEEVEIAEDDVIASVTFKNEASAMRITDGVATKL